MGRKRAGPGKYFYFCLALLIFLTGCSLLQESNRRREMRDSLATGNQLLGRGDFDGSLRAFQSVAAAAQEKPPADVALYRMGLVHAHPQNPRRDLHKALGAFSQLVSAYPASPWAETAKIWVGVLEEAENSKRDIEKSREAIEKSRQEVEQNRQAMEKSKREIERSRLELEKIQQEIEKTKQVIEKSKQVDMEIDQKRRERGR
jgi:outer membrane protein assembly factor BamD (BamD/ComL family)